MTESQGFRIVHAIAQLRLGAGRYVVDTAIAQHRREPGAVAVAVSDDSKPPQVSSPALLDELSHAGVPVIRPGDFTREAVSLKGAARTLRAAVIAPGGQWRTGAVVHAHTPMAAAMARWAGAPRIVLSCRGWSQDRPAEIDLQDALAYSFCHAVTSPSRHWADVVREHTAAQRVAIIPYGLDLSRVAHAQTGVPSAPRIVCVGELTHRKGQDLLLDAMPYIWTRLPQAELHLFGEGDAATALRERAAALDASGSRIVFHGMVSNPWALTSPYDVFAQPARADSQPVALIEAMAAGLPIVATGVGDIPALVEDARCGLIARPGNIFELRMSLSVLLETSAEGRRELGSAGLAYAHRLFDMASHLERLDALYMPQAPAVAPPPAFRPETVVGPLRLHLGCGRDRRDGWVNIDASADVKPDVVTRVHTLPMFGDASVDTIEACHLFEHLPLHEARAALKEWARVLRPGGELLLELPNFDACIRILGQGQDPRGNDIGMIGIFGWPPGVEKDGDFMTHRWGWTPHTLGAAAEAAGFGNVEVLPVTQTWRPATRFDRDFRIRAIRTSAVAEVAA